MSKLTSEDKFLQYTRLYQATNRIILVNQLFAELQNNSEFTGNATSETIKAISGALDSAFQEVYRPLARLEVELRESLLKIDRPPTEDAVKLDNIVAFCDSEHPAWESTESAQKYMDKRYVEGYTTGWDRAMKRLKEDIVKLIMCSNKHDASESEAT